MAAGEVIFEIIGATSVCVPVTVVLVMAYWKKARAEIEAAGRGDQARRGPLGTHNKTSDITHREEAL